MTSAADSDVEAGVTSQDLAVMGSKLPATSFRRMLAWALAGNLVFAASQWGLLVVLARLGGPGLVGAFSFALALTAPIFMLSNLQLSNLVATDGRHRYSFDTYLGLRLQTAGLAILGCGAAALALGASPMLLAVVLTLAGAKAVEAASDIHYGLLQQHDRMREMSLSQAARGLCGLGGVWLGVGLGGGLIAASAGLAIAWLGVLLLYDRAVCQDLVGYPVDSPVQGNARWVLARSAFPLGVTAMLISLNVNIPRLGVERFLGQEALGIYAVMAYFVVGGRMLAVPLAQVATPRFGRLLAAGDRRGFQRLLARLVLGMAGLGLAGVAGAVLAGRPLLGLLYGVPFAAESRVLVLLMVAAAFGYVSTLLQFAAVADRRLKPQALVLASAVATSLLGCRILVPRLGMPGAAWATIASAIVELAGSVLLVRGAWRAKRTG